METTLISKCCKVQVKHMDENPVTFHCPKCKKICEVEEVCANCLGTGEVGEIETTHPGEPYTAPNGTRKCICQKEKEFKE